jgi:serine/threonine protein kinase
MLSRVGHSRVPSNACHLKLTTHSTEHYTLLCIADLKTHNIFLKSDGIVMLGDFGICKVLEKTADFATTVTGTPYYM